MGQVRPGAAWELREFRELRFHLTCGQEGAGGRVSARDSGLCWGETGKPPRTRLQGLR